MKRVVVVDDEDVHAQSGWSQASRIASITAPAFASDSRRLGGRVGVGHDPAARLEVGLAVAHERRADVDAGVEVAGVGQVADRAAVGAALDRLQLVDDLHGADLGRARQRAGGQRGAQRVHRRHLLAQPPGHRRDDVDHVRVGLHGHQLVDADAAVLADAAEVVAPQVHQHHVLGALLGVGQQLVGQLAVGAAARAGAGDRAQLHAPAAHLHERLRRGAGDLEVPEVEEVHVGAGVDRAQAAVDRERLDRAVRGPALRGDHLVGVAGVDVLDRPPHGGGVAVRAEVGEELGRLLAAAPDPRDRAGELLAHVGDRVRRGLVGELEVVLGEHVGEDRDLVAQVVEGHQQVGDHQREVWDSGLVRVRRPPRSARRCERGRSRTGPRRRPRRAAAPRAGRSGSGPAPRPRARRGRGARRAASARWRAGESPRNDQRPTRWPCSADSSRNDGPLPRSLR